jgi:outer membrane protein TolC
MHHLVQVFADWTGGLRWRRPRRHSARRPVAVLLGALVLSGCASFSADGGFGPMRALTRPGLDPEVQLRWAREPNDQSEINRLVMDTLSRPLSIEAAVQVALLNNRGLQAAYAELGISEARLVQAGRLSNPGLRIGRAAAGDELEWEWGVYLNLARLLLMQPLRQLEARRVERVQVNVAGQVLALAAETRRAWIHAVAAEEQARYSRQVMQAAEAGAELARRMARVGNFSTLQQAREQAFYADAALDLARAEQHRLASRERLTRLMGLWGEQTRFALPERLPALPSQARDLPDLERQALVQRLDVREARTAVELTARQLGLTRVTHFVNVLDLEAGRTTSNEGPTERAWELSLELPLFDWGETRVAQAQGLYMQALHRAAQSAIAARSEVREAFGVYRSAWDIARHHREEIVPLRARIAEENLLRYNGMLIGVFELLADARAQIASVSAAIGALREFWIAQSDLDMAMVGRPALPTLADPTLARPVQARPGH